MSSHRLTLDNLAGAAFHHFCRTGVIREAAMFPQHGEARQVIVCQSGTRLQRGWDKRSGRMGAEQGGGLLESPAVNPQTVSQSGNDVRQESSNLTAQLRLVIALRLISPSPLERLSIYCLLTSIQRTLTGRRGR